MKVYYPSRFIDVQASAPHEHAAYRVSVGLEHWPNADGSSVGHRVRKVQMAYSDGNGGPHVVSGRRSPSYPLDSDDYQRVLDAMAKLEDGMGTPARGMVEVGSQ